MTIPPTMRASQLDAPHRLTVRDVPVPAMEDSDVLVRIASVGLCGSDVHFFEHGRVGDLVVDFPLILGHEASGTIVAAGPGVDPSRIGERVAIEPQRPCRSCRYCRTGRYNLCTGMRFASAPPVDGAFAEYLAVPTDFAYAIDDRISDDAAALLEPLSVAIAAVRKAEIVPGKSVLISGAGPIGVLTAAAAVAFGAVEVVVSEPQEGRHDAARHHGATRVVDPRSEQVDESSVDAFIDASGSEAAITTGLRALKPGSPAVLVGMGAEEIRLDLFLLQSRELRVLGLFRYVDTWPTAIAMARSGSIDLDSLVSARFGLGDLPYAMAHNGDPDVMKYVITP